MKDLFKPPQPLTPLERELAEQLVLERFSHNPAYAWRLPIEGKELARAWVAGAACCRYMLKPTTAREEKIVKAWLSLHPEFDCSRLGGNTNN